MRVSARVGLWLELGLWLRLGYRRVRVRVRMIFNRVKKKEEMMTS